MSKEMVGGCCVCSDERGWTENPLVYCDGQGCSVAVHQACYGIVTVPTGPWYCRKCESQERSARVRCELCPSKDGALKRTDNSSWAHVVCALYIPEVRFGNVTTMEPIILQLIPDERFSKICYLCQEQGKGAKSTIGACMQCNKAGCKLQFHVTCAQMLGLLCEEAGNYLDNVKYCGYCEHHYSKLKKGGNVKTIPPYKPVVTGDNGSSDSSPEKDTEAGKLAASNKAKKALIPGKPPGAKLKSHSPGPSLTPDASGTQLPLPVAVVSPELKEEKNESSTLKFGTTSSHSYQQHDDQKKKFTTSNFVETVVTQSDSVFGADKSPPQDTKNTKKRKEPGAETATSASASSTVPTMSSNLSVNLKNPTVNITNLKTNVISSASKSTINLSTLKPTSNPTGGSAKASLTVTGSGTKITISTQREPTDSKVDHKKSSKTEVNPTNGPASKPVTTTSGPGIVVSVPLAVTALSGGDKTNQETVATDVKPTTEIQPAKRARSISSEKSKKNRRSGQQKRGGRSSSGSNSNLTTESIHDNIKESPPSSPLLDEKKPTPKKKQMALPPPKTEDVKPFQNGAHVPHMLGNQLNPSSEMAKRMHDSLNQEIEAHSVYAHESSGVNIVGPQLHSRVIASVRAEKTNSPAPTAALNPQSQSLDQLLERQWEQGSQFLMEQAQHFDIASLLSCLHQLKAENLKLEESVQQLIQRRDHLLAVNARLAVPLTTPQTQQNLNQQTNQSQIMPNVSMADRVSARVGQHTVENGISANTDYPMQQRTVSQASPIIRHNPNANYNSQGGVVRAAPMANDQRRPNNYSGYHGQVPVVSSPSVGNPRRDDLHQQM